MKIGVNLIGIMPSIGGAYNYVEHLITSIDQHDTKNDYLVFITEYSKPIVKNLKKATVINCSVDSKYRIFRIIYENTVLPFLAKYHKLDKMLWPLDTIGFINSVPSIVISHDFLGLIHPENYSLFKRFYLQLALRNTLNNAEVFLPISNTTSEELMSLTKRELGELKVLPNILDYKFKRSKVDEILAFKEKYNLFDRFWLYVAHYYPHKNHKKLLVAYSRLKKINPHSYKLVLRGNGLEENIEILEIIDQFNLSSDIIFMPQLESDELPKLYSAATALVFPSLYEGGGIPIMEAMACGCPVVASKIPTTIEFANNSTMLFNPNSIDSIVNSMNSFQLSEEKIKDEMIKNGYDSIKKLRPEIVISTLISSYQE